MNKKVDSEFKSIKDIYQLQCLCTELSDILEKDKILIKEANDRAYSEFKENNKLINENANLKFNNRKLNSIIKEAIEFIHWRLDNGEDMYITQMTELLEILDKGNK